MAIKQAYESMGQDTALPENEPLSVGVGPIVGALWFSIVLLIYCVVFAGYVLLKIHRDGPIENWARPRRERKALREEMRKKKVGIIWCLPAIWKYLVAKLRTRTGKNRQNGDGEELNEHFRLERMHTTRRKMQRENSEKKSKLLARLEKLRAMSDDEFNSALGNGEYDIEAQSSRLPPSRAEYIKLHLDKIKDFDSSEDGNVGPRRMPRTPPAAFLENSTPQQRSRSLDGTTVMDSHSGRRPRPHDQNTFTHETRTNGSFNTPESPLPNLRYPQGNHSQESPSHRPRYTPHSQRHPHQRQNQTWNYADEVAANQTGGAFTQLTRSIQKFERGDPAPHFVSRMTHELGNSGYVSHPRGNGCVLFDSSHAPEYRPTANFSKKFEAGNGVAESNMGNGNGVGFPGAARVAPAGSGSGRMHVRGRELEDPFTIGEGSDEDDEDDNARN